MRYMIKKVNTRTGFFGLLLILFWLKTMLAYFMDFTLGVSSVFQWIILFINPIATAVLFMGLAFYIKNTKLFYGILMIIYAAQTLLLYLNVIYFREFSDFITLNTVLGYSSVDKGLNMSSIALTSPHDIFYWIDIVIIFLLLVTRIIKLDTNSYSKKKSFALTSASLLLFTFNLTLAEMSRPQLLTRTFDSRYIVKYLGVTAYSIYNSIETEENQSVRADATKSQVTKVIEYVKKNYVKPNKKLFGLIKGKNVIIIHLESFQQFLIDDKVEGQTVTPFLNKLYHSKSTISFSNFFHQVGQGKTSDAENMLETGTFGLPEGSLFSQLGSTQTFQSAPAILEQKEHYTTAVFHGDVASFWNRNNVYKNMGYQYFFSAQYYDTKGDNSIGYGLKDKLLFNDSVKYLEHLQQPFYVKYITLTNHFPYDLTSEDSNFKTPNTGNDEVDNYFKTANYLDQSVAEFFKFLKKSGLEKNSVIVLYGDHYGLSNSENPYLSETFSQDPSHFKWYKEGSKWTNWDNAQLQRVPFMISIPGYKGGGINKTYGGEIDVLPTLLHLLGVNTSKYLEFGSDLLASGHKQTVAFRNRSFVTPNYSDINGKFYNAKGKIIKLKGNLKKKATASKKEVDQQLDNSDELNQENLLRFYTPKGFKKIEASKYNYNDGLQRELKIQNELGNNSTSLYSKNGNKDLQYLYQTDAPELKENDTTVSSQSSSQSANLLNSAK